MMNWTGTTHEHLATKLSAFMASSQIKPSERTLIKALIAEDFGLAKSMMEAGASLDIPWPGGLSCLMVDLRKQAALEFVLENSDPRLADARDASGLSCAHKAAASGDVSLLRVVLSLCGSAPFPSDKAGLTPLHWAVKSGSTACFELLAPHYDIGQKDGAGLDCSAHAKKIGNEAMSRSVKAAIAAKREAEKPSSEEAVETLLESMPESSPIAGIERAVLPIGGWGKSTPAKGSKGRR